MKRPTDQTFPLPREPIRQHPRKVGLDLPSVLPHHLRQLVLLELPIFDLREELGEHGVVPRCDHSTVFLEELGAAVDEVGIEPRGLDEFEPHGESPNPVFSPQTHTRADQK